VFSPAILLLAASAAASPTAANDALPGPLEAVTRVDIASTGAPDTRVRTGGRVVFHNRAPGSTRILFASRNATAFDCEADGNDVVRSRRGQYLLRGGAKLACTVRPGKYRYTTMTLDGGGVHRGRSILHVRN